MVLLMFDDDDDDDGGGGGGGGGDRRRLNRHNDLENKKNTFENASARRTSVYIVLLWRCLLTRAKPCQ